MKTKEFIDTFGEHSAEIVGALIKENQSVLEMLNIHGNERNRLPIELRLEDLLLIKQEIEKI